MVYYVINLHKAAVHHKIYREFEVSFAPGSEPREVTKGTIQNEDLLYVKLKHTASLKEVVFKLIGGVGSPERWVEEQIMRRFPETEAAAELRALYGVTAHTLKNGWEKNFGDRVYVNLTQMADSPGTRFWETLVPLLPALLYKTMCERAVLKLSQAPASMELRAGIQAVRGAWLAVLKEARTATWPMTGLPRLSLDLNGWETEKFKSMSILEFAQFKEKAMLALLTLDYLTDEDWVTLLHNILIPEIFSKTEDDILSH